MDLLKRLARNRLLDVAVAVLALLCAARLGPILMKRVDQNDFAHFYLASGLLLEGRDPYTTPLPPLYTSHGFLVTESIAQVAGYPPAFLWLFAPLTMLPLRVGFAIWLMGEVACVGMILWLTRRLLGNRLSGRGWFFICAATVISPSLFWHLYYSQAQLLLAVLVLGAYAWHLRGRDTLACLTVTAAGLLKLYPFVFLPWFLWRSTGSLQARVARALWMVAAGVGAVLVTGPGLWWDFIRFGMPAALGPEIEVNFHYSLSSLVINMGFATTGFHPSTGQAHFWWTVGTAIGLSVIALAYLFCLRTARDDETEFTLLTVAMLTGTVTVQGHYFVWLIFPLALAAVRVAESASTARILWLALILLTTYNVTPPDPLLLWTQIHLWVLINCVPLYGLLALGVFLAKELAISKSPRQPGPGENGSDIQR